uniref:Uncharacterized protein n=1 Tax=Propionibacterium freudenreichii TaxID=1744 RepID=A0A2C7AQY8_9ACTN
MGFLAGRGLAARGMCVASGSSWFVTQWMVVVIRRIETLHLRPDQAGPAAI